MHDIDRITATELKQLAGVRADRCLSLLMPAHRAGPETRQDPIRLKNSIREARDRLVAADTSEETADSLLQPASALLDDREFWQHQGDGLALFFHDNQFRRYRTDIALPEAVFLQDRLYLVPILPQATRNSRFLLLCLNPNRVRLLEADRNEIHECQIPDLPKDFGELGRYIDSEKQLQYHTGAAPQGGGSRAAVFHGHGGGGSDASERKQRLVEFSRLIDRAWQQGMPDAADGHLPLLLACDKSLAPLYREANSYAGLWEPVVTGNPDQLPAAELHRKAWSFLTEALAAERRSLLDGFREAEAAGRGSRDVAMIVPAAAQGRVAKLLIADGARQWGQFDTGQQKVTLEPTDQGGAQELVNLAAGEVLLNGGDIHVLAADNFSGPLAAVLRY